MPKYEVTEQSFIDNRLVPAGEVIDFPGLPGRNLKPMDGEAEAMVIEAKTSSEQAMKDLIANTRPLGQGDPNDFAAAVAAAVGAKMAEIMADLKLAAQAGKKS